jgi:alpha-glucosidase
MYARWIEEGVYVPIMRAHGMLNQDRWPWAFGDDAYAAAKQAIQLRYRLIPYLYSCAAETSKTGAPIMRPLFLNYPSDKNTFNMKDEWFFGPSILAAPIVTEGGSRTVYLPQGQWYDFNTGARYPGSQTVSIANAPLTEIPAYIPAGSIVPLGPVLQYTEQAPEDPLDVHVYPGGDGKFSLYEDDGMDYKYEKGQSSTITFRWEDRQRTLTVDKRSGSYPGMLKIRHLNIVLPDGRSKATTYIGEATEVKF